LCAVHAAANHNECLSIQGGTQTSGIFMFYIDVCLNVVLETVSFKLQARISCISIICMRVMYAVDWKWNVPLHYYWPPCRTRKNNHITFMLHMSKSTSQRRRY